MTSEPSDKRGRQSYAAPATSKHPLVELCGGRFAVVPAKACSNSKLSNGAFRLYAQLSGCVVHSDVKPNQAKFHLKSFAAALGRTPRAVQNWQLELEVHGFIERLNDPDKAIALYRVNRNPSDILRARLRNLPKIEARKKRKDSSKSPKRKGRNAAQTKGSCQPTSEAAKARSHPRSESECTHIKTKIKILPCSPSKHLRSGNEPHNYSRQSEGEVTKAKASSAKASFGTSEPAELQFDERADWCPNHEEQDLLAKHFNCSRQDVLVRLMNEPGTSDQYRKLLFQLRARN